MVRVLRLWSQHGTREAIGFSYVAAYITPVVRVSPALIIMMAGTNPGISTRKVADGGGYLLTLVAG